MPRVRTSARRTVLRQAVRRQFSGTDSNCLRMPRHGGRPCTISIGSSSDAARRIRDFRWPTRTTETTPLSPLRFALRCSMTRPQGPTRSSRAASAASRPPCLRSQSERTLKRPAQPQTLSARRPRRLHEPSDPSAMPLCHAASVVMTCAACLLDAAVPSVAARSRSACACNSRAQRLRTNSI